MKINKLIYLPLLVLLLVISCDSKSNKTLSFAEFDITVPYNWNKIKLIGIDSEVGGFTTGLKDTIAFSYGKNVYSMKEVLKVNDVKEKRAFDSIGIRTDDMFFSKYPKVDQNQGVFHNEYYMYDSIDNYQVKISLPKRISEGVTGIYFDSLSDGNSLYIYGNNLETIEHQKLIESFKTMKIN
jgi:hypothetical protein